MGKIKFCGLLVVGGAFFMSSCLGNEGSKIEDWSQGNAQIATFSLSNDSIKGLSKVVFTIDQVNGKIYNRDSMPYGTVINEKVICTLSYEYAAIGTIFVSSATGDTVYWNGTDSVDFSSPVWITVYPYDGVSTKTYETWINIHQVNPDSMVWELYPDLIPEQSCSEMNVLSYDDSYYMYTKDPSASETGAGCKLYKSETSNPAKWEPLPLTGMPDNAVLSRITGYKNFLYAFTTDGKLFRSTDGRDWSQVLEGVPYIEALIGSIPRNKTGRSPVLSGISKEEDETLRFVTMNENMEWQTGPVTPTSFPLSGFGVLNYEAMYYPYLSISGGRDRENQLSGVTWSTTDGLSWIPVTNEQSNFCFSAREGSVFFSYDTLFYLIGGLDAFGTALKDVYYSKDKGATWRPDTVLITMPEDYAARGFSSVVTDKDNFILLFGGKVSKDTNMLNQLWRGRITRLGFKMD
jgi:hypothetical protein